MSDSEKKSIYDKLTPSRKKFVDDFLKLFETENLDWKKGWLITGSPISAITGKRYNGVNRMFLGIATMQRGYTDNRWLTYKQMEEKGWTFKRDEEGNNLGKNAGVPIEYFELRDKKTKKPFDRNVLDGMDEDEKNEYLDENVYALRKYYHVFNGDIIDGIPEKETALADPDAINERAENLIQLWSDTVVPISYGGDSAYYTRATDKIRLPERGKFFDLPSFYETTFHEISHSTGHESRLNRDMGEGKLTPEYAVEELRAEIAAMFLVQDLGVAATGKHIENNAAYVKAWHERIKADPNVLFKAIADAERITKYVLAKEQQNAVSAESDEGEAVEELTEEKSEIYMRPSEVAAREEEKAKTQPVETEIKGIEKITDMDDGEILERACKSKHGKKFIALWNGDKVLGDEEKDERSLMARLAMYTGGDAERLLRLFSISPRCNDNKPTSYYEEMAREEIAFVASLKVSAPPTASGANGRRFANAK